MSEVLTPQRLVVCIGGPLHLQGIQSRGSRKQPYLRVRRQPLLSQINADQGALADTIEIGETVYHLTWLAHFERYVYVAAPLNIEQAMAMLLDSVAARGERRVVE